MAKPIHLITNTAEHKIPRGTPWDLHICRSRIPATINLRASSRDRCTWSETSIYIPSQFQRISFAAYNITFARYWNAEATRCTPRINILPFMIKRQGRSNSVVSTITSTDHSALCSLTFKRQRRSCSVTSLNSSSRICRNSQKNQK